jgi:TrmH family RNA methyltransferase
MSYYIQSRSNPKIKRLVKQKENYFFFEGEKLVRDILERDIEIAILVVSAKNENTWTNLVSKEKAVIGETWVASESVLAKLSSLKETPGVIAVLEMAERPVNFQQAKVIIGLDNIQDPANAGTVFRCAAAFGIDAVVFTGASVKPNNSKFLRTAQNALFEVRWQRFEKLETLVREAEKADLNVYVTSSRPKGQSLSPQQVKPPCLILFGNEGKGLDEDLLLRFQNLTIPHSGSIESLNAGVSACIVMYELRST